MYVFCLSCPSATFALQHGGFVPREWLAAKGLFSVTGEWRLGRCFVELHYGTVLTLIRDFRNEKETGPS